MTERTQLIAGIGLVIIGFITTILFSVVVHMTEAPLVNDLGQDIYPNVPRGWIPATIAQSIALGGTLMAMAGLILAYVYKRPMNWARAMVGALVFTGLMFIIFAVVPNQMLTVFQSNLEWTPQKIFITAPGFVVMNNNVAISYAALKDMLVAGYATTMLFAVPIFMYQWQKHSEKADVPKPEPVSSYGRPMRTET